MGTGSVIQYGNVQRMSAGSGVVHGEFNHSTSAPLHVVRGTVTVNGVELKAGDALKLVGGARGHCVGRKRG